MTTALREKLTKKELMVLKDHTAHVEELILEGDNNAAQDYLDTITGDAKRLATLLMEGQA